MASLVMLPVLAALSFFMLMPFYVGSRNTNPKDDNDTPRQNGWRITLTIGRCPGLESDVPS